MWRSIPACAGEPHRATSTENTCWVYPRVCGGTMNISSLGMSMQGLSPRVRGNRHRACIASILERSIPACAGEPAVRAEGRRVARVYPRVCGGTGRGPREAVLTNGLSPRVRGNQGPAFTGLYIVRSIPACAGEPPEMKLPIIQSRVYPRVCGGTESRQSPPAVPPGLSPRVRGNHHPSAPRLIRRGSIPACAGEPRNPRIPFAKASVYPRVCGGTIFTTAAQANLQGLSPRVRGTEAYLVVKPWVLGLSPRVRGNPGGLLPSQAGQGSIPAVCGGTSFLGTVKLNQTGLSPRVRGNRVDSTACGRPDGSIPACAGEPGSLPLRLSP